MADVRWRAYWAVSRREWAVVARLSAQWDQPKAICESPGPPGGPSREREQSPHTGRAGTKG
eukprot:5621933-Prymnesium_polylepis.1